MRRLVGVVLAAMAPILWATNIVASRVIVTHGVHPFVLTAVRWSIAGAALALYSLARLGRIVLHRRLLLVGLLGITLFSNLVYAALFYAPAALVGLIIGLVPVSTMIVGRLFYSEHVDKLLLASGLVGFAGVGLIEAESLAVSASSGTLVWLGGLLALASVFVWAFYTLESRRLVVKGHPIAVLAGSTLESLPFNYVFAAPFLAPSLPHLHDSTVALLILYVALVPGFLAYLVWMTAVKLIGAASTNIYVNLLPLAALLLAVILLGERLTMLQLLGAVLILASAFITGYREAKLRGGAG